MERIYLDNSASTPTAKEVLRKMMPYFSEKYGNASSLHFFGQEAQSAIDEARTKASKFLSCNQEEVFFTGSATEANNLAIVGVMRKIRKQNKNAIPHIITSSIEHESILEPIKYYTKMGYITSDFIPVSKEGFVLLEELKNLLKEETALVSVMYANNEIGTIQNIKEISLLIRKFNKENNKEILFHTDAAQSANFLNCDTKELGVDMLTISGHKVYGPKGVGILFVKKGAEIEPLILGSKQEAGVRSGTENIPAIVGVGAALEIIEKERKNIEKISFLRDKLAEEILKSIENSKINGSMKKRIHHNLNVSFLGVDREDLVVALDILGIAVSAGAACYSKALKTSHVLSALGLPEEEKKSSIRITLGRSTTEDDIKKTVDILKKTVENLRR